MEVDEYLISILEILVEYSKCTDERRLNLDDKYLFAV
jgi:hypothetical protein